MLTLNERTNIYNKVLVNISKYYPPAAPGASNSQNSCIDTCNLTEIFKPVTETNTFGSAIAWLILWEKPIDSELDTVLHYIKADEFLNKDVVSVYAKSSAKKKFAEYVTTYGRFCDLHDHHELSFLIGINGDVMVGLGNDNIVAINFKSSDAPWNKNKTTIPKQPTEIINILEKKYRALQEWTMGNGKGEFDQTVSILRGHFPKEIKQEEVIKLLNSISWLRLAHHSWKMVFAIPGIIAKKYFDIPLGVNIGLKEKIELSDLYFLREIILLFCTRRAVDYFEEKVRLETVKHGTKAAVSAIMSRNMSHNIGSHVLSYWGNKLSKEKPDINDLKPSKDLFNYLKQRMDFIAEITTTTPAWEKTLSLKKDIIEDYTNQFALLDNIARSEGFCYSSDHEPMCKKIKGIPRAWISCKNNGTICERLPQNLKEICLPILEPLPMKIIYKPSEDFSVSIPHGVVGKQAFYSILENFIRNSAKHGGSCIRGKIQNNPATALEFTIDAEDDVMYSDYIRITISDNIGNCCAFINSGKRVIDILNDAINDDEYIKSEDGRIKKGSWGIKEMKVSANFLRKKEVDILVSGHENDKNEPPLMQLTCYSKCETTKSCAEIGNQNISLTFFLRKPKEACIVTNNNIKSNSKHGIDVFSYEEFKNVLNKEAIPHRFLVLDQPDKNIFSLTDSNRKQLPCRVVVNGRGSNNDTKNKWLTPAYLELNFEGINGKPETFLLNLYEKFLTDKIGESPTILMRNIKVANGGNWAENNICITEEPQAEILKRLIIFDNHHEMVTKDKETESPKIPESLYYQGISSSTSFGKTLENVPSGDKKKLFLKELTEAVLIKVLIADERIWKNSQDKINTRDGGPVERRELLKKMGIYLVPIDGNIISETERNKVLNGEYADIVFFIIHKGLVEKMNEVKEEKIGTEFVGEVVNKIPFVMIDSGRGEPEYLEPGTRYVPMSAIESFLEEMDKYSLIQTLFSVRRFENAR